MPAKKKIDPEEIRKLAAIGCSVREIADFLHCGHATISRRFQGALEEGRASGAVRAKGRIYQKGVVNGEFASLELYLINQCGWSRKPEVQVTTNVIQNGAPQRSEAETKAHLVDLQRAIFAEALAEQSAQDPALPER